MKTLIDTFNSWWPAWVPHVLDYIEGPGNSIAVTFQDDGYMTSNAVYHFGMNDDGTAFLHKIDELNATDYMPERIQKWLESHATVADA